jgi:hypothetical protein
VHCNASRVKRDYPDPDPIFRVPVFSGSKIILVSSGVSLSNPKFLLPEKPDPIIRVYPNAQHESPPLRAWPLSGAMYTVGDTCWSAPPPVWFGPAVHLPTLRRLRMGSASTWANLELESPF